MRAWLALFSAIACEVTGTLALKVLGVDTPLLAAAITGGAIILSYLLLSLAFRRIPIAVAFAVWESLGLGLVTLLGVILLGEHLGGVQLMALGGLLLGAWLLHSGTRSHRPLPYSPQTTPEEGGV